MDPDRFTEQLRRDGYDEIVTLDVDPDRVIAEHVHAWDVRALVLSGEMLLTRCDGGDARVLRAGDVFELPRDLPHAERYGPAGYSMLVGRRHAARTAD